MPAERAFSIKEMVDLLKTMILVNSADFRLNTLFLRASMIR